MDTVQKADVLVIGSGIAGLSFALHVAEFASVILVTKRGLSDANTAWAQGGIAAVLDPAVDSFATHITDTLTAGAGLCRRDVVEMIVEHGPAAIARLIELGVDFDRNPQGALLLAREGKLNVADDIRGEASRADARHSTPHHHNFIPHGVLIEPRWCPRSHRVIARGPRRRTRSARTRNGDHCP